MQELRSTQIVDNEIQVEARKKAEKILKKSEAEAIEILTSVDKAIERTENEKKDFYEKKFNAFKRDLEASVPLENERFKISFIQNQLTENINDYFSKMKDVQILEVVSKSCSFKVSQNVKTFVYGFDLSAAEKFLSQKLGKNLISCEKTEFGKRIIEDDCGLTNLKGVILEAEDNSFRIRLTLSQIVSNLMDKEREKMAEILFGGSL